MNDDEAREELLSLGFPEKAIQEAMAARAAGLFALSPRSEDIERTIAACAGLFPERPSLGRRFLSWLGRRWAARFPKSTPGTGVTRRVRLRGGTSRPEA